MKKLLKKYVKPGKWEVVIPFDKEGMELAWLGIVDGREPGEYSLTVVAEHNAPNTKGRVTIRAVCGEESVITLKGVIRIGKEAQETNDFLELRVLTLGPTSRATASPELEILANNVVASHGASVGGVDPEHILYLRGKGIGMKNAIDLVTSGFLLE